MKGFMTHGIKVGDILILDTPASVRVRNVLTVNGQPFKISEAA